MSRCQGFRKAGRFPAAVSFAVKYSFGFILFVDESPGALLILWRGIVYQIPVHSNKKPLKSPRCLERQFMHRPVILLKVYSEYEFDISTVYWEVKSHPHISNILSAILPDGFVVLLLRYK